MHLDGLHSYQNHPGWCDLSAPPGLVLASCCLPQVITNLACPCGGAWASFNTIVLWAQGALGTWGQQGA